jgi:hypothetical protein
MDSMRISQIEFAGLSNETNTGASKGDAANGMSWCADSYRQDSYSSPKMAADQYWARLGL